MAFLFGCLLPQQPRHESHLSQCSHLVLLCCYMIDAQLFLLPQHVPHTEHTRYNHTNQAHYTNV